MTDNPCATCGEDCLGGIIYGNCQRFRTWCRNHHYTKIGASQRTHVHTGETCRSRAKNGSLFLNLISENVSAI